MEKMNALTIQEILKKKDSVSIPWIQTAFSLDYKDAKEFLCMLMKRGWVEKETQGVEFAVLKKNLRLRKLTPDEVDPLIEDLTTDCATVLKCIVDEDIGATFEEIEDEVHGQEDTRTAIEILTKHNLIYKAGDYYLTAVSRRTVTVLENVVRGMRQSELKRRISGKEDGKAFIWEMFAVLFDED